MSTALRIVAILMIAIGGIWILQGLNILPGSFMTGQMQWAIYGGLLAIAGVVLMVLSRRR